MITVAFQCAGSSIVAQSLRGNLQRASWTRGGFGGRHPSVFAGRRVQTRTQNPRATQAKVKAAHEDVMTHEAQSYYNVGNFFSLH
eukprot:393794-Amphidinium_carterae.1